MIVIEPWLQEGAPAMKQWSAGCTLFFSPICHQEAGRSWMLWGNSMPVCARCTGIYGGFLLASLLLLFRHRRASKAPAPILLWAAIMPSVLEFALEKAGLTSGTLLTRALLGALAGFVVPFYLLPALEEVAGFLSRQGRRS